MTFLCMHIHIACDLEVLGTAEVDPISFARYWTTNSKVDKCYCNVLKIDTDILLPED